MEVIQRDVYNFIDQYGPLSFQDIFSVFEDVSVNELNLCLRNLVKKRMIRRVAVGMRDCWFDHYTSKPEPI